MRLHISLPNAELATLNSISDESGLPVSQILALLLRVHGGDLRFRLSGKGPQVATIGPQVATIGQLADPQVATIDPQVATIGQLADPQVATIDPQVATIGQPRTKALKFMDS